MNNTLVSILLELDEALAPVGAAEMGRRLGGKLRTTMHMALLQLVAAGDARRTSRRFEITSKGRRKAPLLRRIELLDLLWEEAQAEVSA